MPYFIIKSIWVPCRGNMGLTTIQSKCSSSRVLSSPSAQSHVWLSWNEDIKGPKSQRIHWIWGGEGIIQVGLMRKGDRGVEGERWVGCWVLRNHVSACALSWRTCPKQQANHGRIGSLPFINPIPMPMVSLEEMGLWPHFCCLKWFYIILNGLVPHFQKHI